MDGTLQDIKGWLETQGYRAQIRRNPDGSRDELAIGPDEEVVLACVNGSVTVTMNSEDEEANEDSAYSLGTADLFQTLKTVIDWQFAYFRHLSHLGEIWAAHYDRKINRAGFERRLDAATAAFEAIPRPRPGERE
jgi:hypothetical protein